MERKFSLAISQSVHFLETPIRGCGPGQMSPLGQVESSVSLRSKILERNGNMTTFLLDILKVMYILDEN